MFDYIPRNNEIIGFYLSMGNNVYIKSKEGFNVKKYSLNVI